MDPKKKANESYGDEYSVWRDYSNPREVGDVTNPDDRVDKEKPRGMGGDPMAEGSDSPVVINWFRGKENRKK